MSANERESSVTESNVPWSEDEGDESDSDNDVTNDLGNKGVAKLTGGMINKKHSPQLCDCCIIASFLVGQRE